MPCRPNSIASACVIAWIQSRPVGTGLGRGVLEAGRADVGGDHPAAFPQYPQRRGLSDTGRGRIADTLEILLIHVDLRHRRAVELPADIADSLDEHIARSRALPWTAPRCGAIGIRR